MMMMVMNVEWGVWIVDCRLWSVDRRWKKMEVRRWGGVYVCKVQDQGCDGEYWFMVREGAERHVGREMIAVLYVIWLLVCNVM